MFYKYGKTLNYTNKQIFPDWLKWYGEEEGAWYDTDFQLSIGLYTNVQTDNDGFIELNTPVEISLINIVATDPTTQEAFKNELIKSWHILLSKLGCEDRIEVIISKVREEHEPGQNK